MKVRLLKPRRLVGLCVAIFCIIFAINVIHTISAYAHSIYEGLRTQAGGSCCSGANDATGDCEMVAPSQVHYKQSTVIISSERYKSSVIVPMSTVQWSTPEGLDANHVGIWCGKPRDKRTYPTYETTYDQPDDNILTYCLFLEPGGV